AEQPKEREDRQPDDDQTDDHLDQDAGIHRRSMSALVSIGRVQVEEPKPVNELARSRLKLEPGVDQPILAVVQRDVLALERPARSFGADHDEPITIGCLLRAPEEIPGLRIERTVDLGNEHPIAIPPGDERMGSIEPEQRAEAPGRVRNVCLHLVPPVGPEATTVATSVDTAEWTVRWGRCARAGQSGLRPIRCFATKAAAWARRSRLSFDRIELT